MVPVCVVQKSTMAPVVPMVAAISNAGPWDVAQVGRGYVGDWTS